MTIYGISIILNKTPIESFEKLEKQILSFVWKNKGLTKVQLPRQREEENEGPALPDINIYYKAPVVKTV